MPKTEERKKRKRPAATDASDAKQDRGKKERKKKARKDKKAKQRKGGDAIPNDGDSGVSKNRSSSLMGSIFGRENSTGSDASPSLMDSIFDNKNRVAAGKGSSSTASLFDNSAIKAAPRSNHHQWKVANSSKTQETAEARATKEKRNTDDAESIRKTLRVRKNRSERRPLLRKALDFPGVFSNEEVDEENGFFLLDDENERAKETADAVREHGLCVIRNVIDTERGSNGDDHDDSSSSSNSGGGGGGHNNPLRDVVLPAAKALQRKLNEALKARDIHHSRETFRFREAASRCKGRTDVVFDALEKDESMAEIRRTVLQNPKVYPVIQNLLGAGGGDGDGGSDTNEDVKLVYAGLIFSYPGSCDQPWHQDGTPLFPELPREQSAMLQASLPPYALNVFLPLEDADGSIEKGPTEFIPNSHKWESPDEKLRLVNGTSDDGGDEDEVGSDSDEADDNSEGNEDNSKDEAIIAPVLKCGDALIYDYRVCHRGTANLFGKLGNTDGAISCDDNFDTAARKKIPKKKKDDGVSGSRRILYLMYARPWFTDHVNFDYKKSAESLFD